LKAVLAYSGGLDTSICVKLLQEKYDCDVITVTVDVGIPPEDLRDAEEKAKKLGVLKHFTVDAKEEFARNYIFRAIKANALYEGYPLSTALARPLTAMKVVDIAKKEGADVLSHGATGKGNDQFRFEAVFRSMAPEMKIIAPIRELNLTRKESISYAEKHSIPIPVDVEKPFSIDENLWGRSIEGGILEDAGREPPEDIFKWTIIKEEKPEIVEVEFDEGVPTAINGVEKSPVELIKEMNRIAGRHGVGRIDIIEDRITGIKSRENYECPAAISLIKAHKQLEQLVLTRRELKFKELVDSAWGELVYQGLWTEPLREALDSFIDKTQTRVAGEVKLKFECKSCSVVARKSKYSIYSKDVASFDEKASEAMWDLLRYHSLQSELSRRKTNER
jgi:argininosuccinate synthase